jgi:hypothetical protein
LERTAVECRHERAEFVGTNPGMTFERCLQCKAVLISNGTTRIAIEPLRKVG